MDLKMFKCSRNLHEFRTGRDVSTAIEDASLKLDPTIPKGSVEMERNFIRRNPHESIFPRCRVTISGRVNVDDTLSRPRSPPKVLSWHQVLLFLQVLHDIA